MWTFYSISKSDAAIDLFSMHKVNSKRIRYTARLFMKQIYKQLKRNHNACVTEYKQIAFPGVKYHYCISDEKRKLSFPVCNSLTMGYTSSSQLIPPLSTTTHTHTHTPFWLCIDLRIVLILKSVSEKPSFVKLYRLVCCIWNLTALWGPQRLCGCVSHFCCTVGTLFCVYTVVSDISLPYEDTICCEDIWESKTSLCARFRIGGGISLQK